MLIKIFLKVQEIQEFWTAKPAQILFDKTSPLDVFW